MTNTNKTFDSLLVLQCQSGNRKAAAILVKRWHVKLCKQAYWYTNDIENSKDIAQDSWSVILQKIGSLKDPNSFGSWALTIVTRNAINWLRKHKKELESLNSYHYDHKNSTNEYDHNDSDPSILLKKSIKKLPHNQQLVLHLFYLEEYSIKQISEIINVSAGTVKSRLFNAREKLKLILKNRNHG
ncbi:RNA polymerase sigma factor [Aquimarina algiphila]|uniref:Sigma-70 family RNA polymerase sigma factor n=1 Tax=Aquimarina algiphila TaxID=2047982 RepID=A0A554VKI1_9FLAO|nr:sigma-70 family RNA polymerase sigma factor [Aquimarina algiphila]TSE08547.1 sigma-70 family RNA polymerase sigma factor [Aquimarina algiphila]